MSKLKDLELIREINLAAVVSNESRQYIILDELLELSGLVESYYTTENDIIRIAGLAYKKGIRLAKSVYFMIIYGYAQESGALLRPLLEIIELMKYISLDNSRITEVISDKKPTAGNIAKKISGDFQDLRSYLNESASHFNFDYYSLAHILDIANKGLREEKESEIESIENDLKTLNSFVFFLMYEYILLTNNIVNYDKEILIILDRIREIIAT